MKQNRHIVLLFVLALFAAQIVNAQAGYSSTAMHWGKMNAQQKRAAKESGVDFFEYGMPRSRDVVIEEYFNYHTHKIRMPEGDESVALDLQWGNEYVSADQKQAILQIGIATSELNKGSLADAPPVNVSLVIDKSGSMSSDNRLVNAKEAASEFVKRLRPTDHISILAFDSYVETVLTSSEVGDRSAALAAIDNIVLGGSTNLNAGLIAGYGEVAKAYEPGQASKVIMLTDALTNTGQIDPSAIVRNSSVFNKGFNIDISVVGVGVDFNTELSRQITGDARSSIHFINDAEDIKKVFIDEVESLLCPVARDARLVMEFDEGIQLENFFGYQPEMGTHRVVVDLNNMNKGLTQVFLARFTVNDPNTEIVPVQVYLEYFDIGKNQDQQMRGTAQLWGNAPGKGSNPLANEEVRKNYAIASMAQSIHDMAEYAEQGNRLAAKETVDKTVGFVNQLFDGQYDTDVKRVLDILTAYQSDMQLALNNN